MRTLAALLLLCLLHTAALADVVEPNEKDRYCKITNLDRFPDYQFYIMFQSFHYDHGYQPNGATETLVYDDSLFSAGSRGTTSYLYARHTTTGEVFQTRDEIGGIAHIMNDEVDYVMDVYEVLGMREGLVEIKMTESFMVMQNGKTKKNKKGMFGGEGGLSPWLYIGLPVVAGLGLAGFFFWRRRRARQEVMPHAAGA